jgi:hypothetical protein
MTISSLNPLIPDMEDSVVHMHEGEDDIENVN